MPRIIKQTTKATRRPTRIGSIYDRITGIEVDDKVKINLYGRSATGKTTFWATFPKPILALICSGPKKPGELKSINTPAYRRSIKQLIVERSEDIGGIAEGYHNNGLGYKTIVLDHATGLQDLVLKEILGIDEVPVQLSWGLASQQQYGQVALQVKERLRSLLNLDCNVVIVAQEREFNTDSNNEIIMPFVASALTPSIVGWLNPSVDYICQTYLRPNMIEKEVQIASKKEVIQQRGKGVQYCLRTAPHDVFTTKFRLPKGARLPEEIVDPTYEKLYKLIQGG